MLHELPGSRSDRQRPASVKTPLITASNNNQTESERGSCERGERSKQEQNHVQITGETTENAEKHIRKLIFRQPSAVTRNHQALDSG
ncbi:hypothetical protein RRG08_012240 [Elysia crispata]|uniref:Uncharacterized protein n=1 Tax=Elysia crispata TaxID=231223 RepID=A0AAE0YP02_9GAST|nr:hypothetical protein RRG08_012240 [Elysia crispata]